MREQERNEAEAGGEAASHTSIQRVKVYRLSDEGNWDDQGTGHVSIDYIEGSKELGLAVVGEEDNEMLLGHNITSEDIYRKQEETIISWRDPEAATELALSFQEAAGCSYIWDNICDIQRNLQFSNLGALEVGTRPALEPLESSRMLRPNDVSFRSANSELRELPPVELSSLPLILKTIIEYSITDQMRVAELITQDREFFPKLVDLFRMCEDLENLDGLHVIFRLVKGIILLNSPSIFDKIFSDEFILDMIGALEYDPEVLKVQNHRAFLKEHVVFKEAIPIKNASVVSKIHQTYRIGYLKDVILPRILDDATLASLNTMIHANNAVVISLLKDDACFIQELFARMRSSNISAESKRVLIMFLHEFCTLSKSLQLVQQLRLFRDLSSKGVFEIISDVLESQDKKLVLAGTDILILFLNQDPNLLRSYIVQQEGNSLLGLLVKGMVTDFGEEMHCQFVEILRILMDSVTMCGAHRDALIEIFYEKHLDQLVDVIASSCPPRSISRSASNSVGASRRLELHCAKPEILSNICELLCFCIVHHPYRINCYMSSFQSCRCSFLMNNAIEKILTLTRRREKFLVVAAVRFMRTIIFRNDEHLIRHIVKFNLLKPIIEAFVENGDKYNMLHSGVLELLEYIRKENLKSLVIYAVEYFWDQLVKFERLGSIQAFKLKYQQSLESVEAKLSTSVVSTRKKAEERGLEKEEEDYFNEDSDEEDSSRRTTLAKNQNTKPKLANGSDADHASARPKSGGLVDYDDDDDEDYNPPPKKPNNPAEDDEPLKISTVKRKPVNTVDGKHADGEVPKRQKIEARISCSKIVASISPTGKHTDSQNKQPPLSPASSMPSSEANDNFEDDCTGSKKHQHALDNPQSARQIGGDCTKVTGNLSTETVVNTTKTSDSEPYSVR